MTHPITPPPELVEQWRNQAPEGRGSQTREMWIATCAAQWGADQELEACCEWLKLEGHEHEHEALFAARRPKPPSLKEEALGGLDQLAVRLTEAGVAVDLDTIRRALEALPND